MPRLNHENLGSVQKTAYLTATIASVDSENDTACFEESGKCPAGSDIPIFYHCQYEEGEEPAQRSNGALEGASGAFAEDDEVIVQCEVVDSTTYKPLYVMGFVDKPKGCCFFEPWRYFITKYNDWTDTYSCFFTLPKVPVTIVNGEGYTDSYLHMPHTGSGEENIFSYHDPSLVKVYWFIDNPAAKENSCSKLKLKFNFSSYYPTSEYMARFCHSSTAIHIFGYNYETRARIFLGSSDGLPVLSDNGGEEQEIDLNDWLVQGEGPFKGPILYIKIASGCYCGEGTRVVQDLDLYYLKFKA